LPQLQEEAAFLTRYDRNYLVPIPKLAELLTAVVPGTRALEIDGRRAFGYTTRYFDTDNTAYFRALRKRPDRFKVRTRRYDERDMCLLEVKVLDRYGRTVKSRFEHDPDRLESLSTLDRAWLQSFPEVRSVAGRLDRSVATHYLRSTLVFPNGTGRMTIDQDLSFISADDGWHRLQGQCVVEIKGPGCALPFDRLLWRNGCRPVPASKFALGVSLTNPALPDNRWHRLRGRVMASMISGVGWSDPVDMAGAG
jgi:hypothetical protein